MASDVEALFVISHEASPAHHPAEGSLYDPSTGQDVEAWGTFDPADHLDDEVEEGGLVYQRPATIGAVGKEMFDPGPALTNGVESKRSPESGLSAWLVAKLDQLGRRLIIVGRSRIASPPFA